MDPTTAFRNKFTAAEPYASEVTFTVSGVHGWGMHQLCQISHHQIDELNSWLGVQGPGTPVL